MNKIVILMFIMISNALYGMELVEQKVKTFIFPTTPPITVIYDDICNRKSKNADMTVIGMQEQIILKNKNIRSCNGLIGGMKAHYNGCVKRKTKVFDQHVDRSHGFRHKSAVIIVDGERFTIENFHEHIEEGKIKSEVIMVVEPQVFITPSKQNEKIDEYWYNRVILDPHHKHTELPTEDYYGKEAIEEALKDLFKSYGAVLLHCCRPSEVLKNIAFAPLSVFLGIPAYRAAFVAISSVIDFINKFQGKKTYNSIEFVLSRLEDFVVYEEILSLYKFDKAINKWTCY